MNYCMVRRISGLMGGRIISVVNDLEEELLNREGTVKFTTGSPERELFNPKIDSTMAPPMSLRMLPRFARLMRPMMANMKLTTTSLNNNPSNPKSKPAKNCPKLPNLPNIRPIFRLELLFHLFTC